MKVYVLDIWLVFWACIKCGVHPPKAESFFFQQSCTNYKYNVPSLNTQSCIKGLLVKRDFCFWAVWAAGPVLQKKLGRLWATFEGAFFMFSWANITCSWFETALDCSIRILKLHNISFIKKDCLNFWVGQIRLILKFSNLSILHKGVLLQDWVFRLGFTSNFSIFLKTINTKFEFLYLRCTQSELTLVSNIRENNVELSKNLTFVFKSHVNRIDSPNLILS